MPESELTHWPVQRTCPFSLPAEYEKLRERSPVLRVRLPSGFDAWVISGLQDIRSMLTDPRFSSDRHNPGFPKIAEGLVAMPDFRASLNEMDAPEHGPKRREVLAEFTVRRMKALSPRIKEIVDAQLDLILRGPKPVDLVSTLSLPVPSLVICELLGVPYTDHDFFQTRTQAMISRSYTPEQRHLATKELLKFLDELVTAKVAEPTDDLLGRLVLKQRENGGIRHREIVELAFLLLGAGHETTAASISLGVVAFLKYPEQLEKALSSPEKMFDAVEELQRFFTIAEAAGARVALEDVELGGVLIRKGEGVIPLSNLADRDLGAFENPDTFDIDRGARSHVAFGHGMHQCLGANLARVQLQVVFESLFRRIPGLRPAIPVAEMAFKADSEIYGMHELPVTW
ncbi:Cytochrome P450 [Amycolatopsis xylanica]|uniref:Cytochrome P450 n=1 Tax=Amycolatopsis xylanica TaxID=589385 RepID=A0A1H3HBY1_9PSEU|nr:cytochrome P450 [Amycolatopsis xylanica]SDY12388.1 Cytochrome P450 [Amycolatopsis xylanica]